MKNKILFINSCVREDSRTKELSYCLLNKLGGEITELDLYKEKISPLENVGIKKRESHNFSDYEFRLAKQFASADIIVIAAPFWDLSFPSVLKIYFENITVSGITFEYSKEGKAVGRCNAKKLYYITTSGGYIGKNNFGFEYIKALAENFFAIGDVCFYSAEGLDILGADVKAIMDETKDKINQL